MVLTKEQKKEKVPCHICSLPVSKGNYSRHIKSNHSQANIIQQQKRKQDSTNEQTVSKKLKEDNFIPSSDESNLEEPQPSTTSTCELPNLARIIKRKTKMNEQLQILSTQELHKLSLPSISAQAEDLLSRNARLERQKQIVSQMQTLNKYQQTMFDYIKQFLQTPDLRRVLIFQDIKGSIGKTFLATYLEHTQPIPNFKFLVVSSSQPTGIEPVIEEVKLAITNNIKIACIINLARDHSRYDVSNIENIIEGTWKYNIRKPCLISPIVKVIIMTNEVKFLRKALSSDRLIIHNLTPAEYVSPDKLFHKDNINQYNKTPTAWATLPMFSPKYLRFKNNKKRTWQEEEHYEWQMEEKLYENEYIKYVNKLKL